MPEDKITKKMLRRAFDEGRLRIVPCPHGDQPVCLIGEHWFYFAGADAEGLRPWQYIDETGLGNVLDEVLSYLEDSCRQCFTDEYKYYRSILKMDGIPAACPEAARIWPGSPFKL